MWKIRQVVVTHITKQKSLKMQCKIILLHVFCLLYLVQCDGITIGGVKCFEKDCKFSEYCSEFDKTCQSCETICDAKSHNYEQELCQTKCQSKYLKKNNYMYLYIFLLLQLFWYYKNLHIKPKLYLFFKNSS